MLTVETVPNVASLVDAINNPISVILHSCCEYDNLEIVAQLRQEFGTIWPYHIEEIILTFFKLLLHLIFNFIVFLRVDKMYQSLIQI